MKKISTILLTIFAIGVIATLFAGGASVLGYIVALIVGGEVATNICATIYTVCFPWIIQICSISVGFGLIGMYLEKKKALTVTGETGQENND